MAHYNYSPGKVDVLRAIEAGRLRVDVATGTIETRRPNPKAIWRTSKLEEILAPHQTKPYFRCTFTNEGVTYRCLVHRAVWFAAARDIPEGFELNHKDGDKSRNGLDNLELMTPGGNQQHAWDTGLKRFNPFHARSCLLTREQVLAIRASNQPRAVLAAEHGVSTDAISRVRGRQTYRSVE